MSPQLGAWWAGSDSGETFGGVESEEYLGQASPATAVFVGAIVGGLSLDQVWPL